MPARAIFRRKRYLIKRGMQFRYIGIVFALVILASIVTGYTVFATGWTLLGEKLASVYPQGRLVYVFRTTNMALMRNLLLVSPFIFLLALIFSHKVAGPVYRIEKSIDEIAGGNLMLKVKLRKGDELKDLAEIINVMTENLRNTMAANKKISVQIQQCLGDLNKAISIEPYDRAKIESSLKELETKITDLNASLNQWTTS